MDKSKKKVRRKVTQACENCREKRVKCSGGRPTCDSCRQLNITCVYNAVTKKRGPRSGYIEEIVSTRVQKLFEKYVSEGLISKKDISILAKNNVDMFKSSEILKCYIEGEDKKEENVENSNLNNNVNFEGNTFLNSENEKREEFLSKLSKINKNKVLIASTVNKAENIGCSMININLSSCNYNIVTVNYDLIESYFEYSHSHFPMLVKEVFLDRIKKNTILPGLLLAVYASALIFRPNPDYNASKKYLRLSHIYCSIYYHSSDIQSIQAISLLANCTCGSNFSWILFGIALRMAYLLKLDEEDKNLSEIYNEERKFTFWYVISKDMLLSVITGRSYRYDLYSFLCSPTIKSILFNFKPKRSYFNLLFQIILANLLQKVIQYVRRRNSRLEEVDLVEKEIDYWFKLLEPEFNYQKSDNIENTSIGEIIGSIHFDIIFSTLKIIYYRHKPTSVITTNRKNHYLEKLISIFLKLDKDPMSEENVDIQSDLNDDKKYQSYPYEFEEIDGFKHKKSGKIKYDYFLKKAYDILKNKRTNFNRKDIEIKSTKDEKYRANSSENILKINTIKSSIIPLSFKINNYLYFKKKPEELLVVDYNTRYMETLDVSGIYIDKNIDTSLKGNNLKFKFTSTNVNDIKSIPNPSDCSKEQNNYYKSTLKRSYSQRILNSEPNDINKLVSSAKRSRSNSSSSAINMEKKKEMFINIDPFKTKNNYEKKVFDSLTFLETSNNNIQSPDDNFIDYIDKQSLHNSTKFNKLLDTNVEPIYIQKSCETESTNYSEFLKGIIDIPKPKNTIDNIDLFVDLKYDTSDEQKFEDDDLNNSMRNLNECYSIAKTNTKKIKELLKYLGPTMTFNFVLCWSFYQIGVIYLIWYVNYCKEEDHQMIKFYESLLERSSKSYVAAIPFLSKFREMISEAETSVKDGTRKLAIKDFF